MLKSGVGIGGLKSLYTSVGHIVHHTSLNYLNIQSYHWKLQGIVLFIMVFS